VKKVEDSCPKICIDLPTNPTIVSNTLTLLSFTVKPKDTVSEARCGGMLMHYLHQLLSEKYKAHIAVNVEKAFEKTVLCRKWWQCRINFYDIYEIVYLTKKRKYRAVEKCLTQVHYRNTECFTSFTITLQIIMDLISIQDDGKTRAVLTYLLYAYLLEAFHHLVDMKQNFIETIKYKCDEFIYCIGNISTLPKYIKKLIINKIEQFHAKLLQM
jgi:hypothetical protein